ncbi:3'-5' exonuclease domain-containing protein [Aphelenchoides besseyi]|nr:3'-5' exonuclease domain-containing protein [Aphelenchoides besseyi]
MIDNEDSVNTILRPFIEDPKNTCFGFDAEFDQSWCGEMGTLSLIQLSGHAQTLLIDIHVLKEEHQWSDEKFLWLFKLIFSHEKRIYGYGFENDLKIRDDPELCPKILGPNSTTQLKLAVIAELILGWHLDKGEQASVWGGFRPLRRLQQRYAAQDAFAVVELGKKLEHKIKLDFPHKLQIVFGPFVWQKDRGVVPNFLKEVSNSRKTKCSQFTDQELWTVVRNVNATLVERQQQVIRSAQAIYIVDQNCAQIGFTLRRIGINVTVGENPEQIAKFMDMHLSAKILSTGKACKRYSYDNRVLNVPTSHSLDVQLSWILTEEKLYIVSNEIRPRCISCNGQKMVYIPHCVMKYLHNQLAVEKSLNWNVSIEEIVHVEKEMSAIDSFASPNQFVALARGDFGLTITINKTLVFLDTVMMCPPRARPSDPERMIKLRLALHRNIFKEPNKTARPSAVCLTCGSENHYTSSA